MLAEISRNRPERNGSAMEEEGDGGFTVESSALPSASGPSA